MTFAVTLLHYSDNSGGFCKIRSTKSTVGLQMQIFQQKVQRCDSVQPLQKSAIPGGALAPPPHKGRIRAAAEEEGGVDVNNS